RVTFDLRRQPRIETGIAFAPQPQRAGADEEIRVVVLLIAAFDAREELLGLAQVARRAHAFESGGHLDERCDRRIEIAAPAIATAVCEDFRVKTHPSRGMDVTRATAHITRRGIHD